MTTITARAPKKARNFTRFRVDATYARETADRMLRTCDPQEVAVGEIQTHAVNKPRNAFSFPSAMVRFKIGSVAADAQSLLTKGKVGMRAFGIGMLIDEGCEVFEAMQLAYC